MNRSIEKRFSTMIDVSHTVRNGLVTYKGLPAPLICDYLSRTEAQSHYAEGVSFQIGKVEMVANTGTYVDSPFHRYAEGKDLAQLPLASLVDLPGLVLRQPGLEARSIGPEAFSRLDVQGKAVLIHTGWDRYWDTEYYFEGHPYLTREAAEHLAGAGATLVGIDSLNIDDTEDLARPVHSILLGADIPIVEHLCNLGALPDEGFRFFAAPVKIEGFGSFPVRAFGLV